MKTRLAYQERLSFKIYFRGCFSNADYFNIIIYLFSLLASLDPASLFFTCYLMD